MRKERNYSNLRSEKLVLKNFNGGTQIMEHVCLGNLDKTVEK